MMAVIAPKGATRMKLVAQAGNIIGQDPLPDDAWQQLEAIADQASGQEALFVGMYFEALIAAASPEQIKLWLEIPAAEAVARMKAEEE